jgi:hypothetical protein
MDPARLADQEPFTAWLRRGTGRDRITVEDKLYKLFRPDNLFRQPDGTASPFLFGMLKVLP